MKNKLDMLISKYYNGFNYDVERDTLISLFETIKGSLPSFNGLTVYLNIGDELFIVKTLHQMQKVVSKTFNFKANSVFLDTDNPQLIDNPYDFAEEFFTKEYADYIRKNINYNFVIAFGVKLDDSIRGGAVLSMIDKELDVSVEEVTKELSVIQKSFNAIYKYAKVSRKLKSSELNLLQSLLNTLQLYDSYTGEHSIDVCECVMRVANEMNLSLFTKYNLFWASILHDVGKIGVSRRVLNKKGTLTVDEYNHIKNHTTLGSKTVDGLILNSNIIDGILHHHERWDGTGYPNNLKAEEIPLISRIITICDTYVAMTTDRPYRGKVYKKEIVETIKSLRGKQFDPEITDVFLRVADKFKDQ